MGSRHFHTNTSTLGIRNSVAGCSRLLGARATVLLLPHVPTNISVVLGLCSLEYSSLSLPYLQQIQVTRPLFRSRVGAPELLQCACSNSFVCGKNYPNFDKLGSKCLSRKVKQNCAISF
jgi:hypothetical protein